MENTCQNTAWQSKSVIFVVLLTNFQAATMVIRDSVEPLLEDYRPPGITSLKFSKLTLGNVAPKIEGKVRWTASFFLWLLFSSVVQPCIVLLFNLDELSAKYLWILVLGRTSCICLSFTVSLSTCIINHCCRYSCSKFQGRSGHNGRWSSMGWWSKYCFRCYSTYCFHTNSGY